MAGLFVILEIYFFFSLPSAHVLCCREDSESQFSLKDEFSQALPAITTSVVKRISESKW